MRDILLSLNTAIYLLLVGSEVSSSPIKPNTPPRARRLTYDNRRIKTLSPRLYERKGDRPQ